MKIISGSIILFTIQDVTPYTHFREVLRYYHYAYRTEGAYCRWIRRYIRFYGDDIHPGELNFKHIEKYLSYLAAKGKVSASTQRQAQNQVKVSS